MPGYLTGLIVYIFTEAIHIARLLYRNYLVKFNTPNFSMHTFGLSLSTEFNSMHVSLLENSWV